MNADMPDIQKTVGLLTDQQLSSGVQSPSLNAGLRLKQTGSISASNRDRIIPQINESYGNNAEEEEDNQKDEVALIQNKHYRVNVISKLSDQGKLGTQPQKVLGLNAVSQINKNNTGSAPVGVYEKHKKYKVQKDEIRRLIASNGKKLGLQCPRLNQNSFHSPKTQGYAKTSSKKPKEGKPEPKHFKDEQKCEYGLRIGQRHSNQGRSAQRSSQWNKEEQRVDEDGFSKEGGKDLKIDIQRKRQWNRKKNQKIYISLETDRERRFHKNWILSENQRLKQIIKIKREQNDNPIQRYIRREESLPRNVEGRIGRMHSNDYLTRSNEMVQPFHF
ncbi:MAG: hypothetical protein EZS28_024432 [Streblomastix strix]|uniref:Uncharacterized protein n=1 Tax=Streblomastix strix TaxID=222440 RepID=A0A5J4VC76_9EUKA|nr:MAG: hypothetical protein EZS28_024432 [Streblomastix strix]